MSRSQFLNVPVPGRNVDALDVDAGVRCLVHDLGYDPATQWQTTMRVQIALEQWAKGEEALALKKATEAWADAPGTEISITEFYRVLAAARAAAAKE